jgi:hypothetical protein
VQVQVQVQGKAWKAECTRHERERDAVELHQNEKNEGVGSNARDRGGTRTAVTRYFIGARR